MSRSRKKPFHSTTCIGARPGVQKEWKKECNNKLRSIPEEQEIPKHGIYKRMSGDIWSCPSDGHVYNPSYAKAWRK